MPVKKINKTFRKIDRKVDKKFGFLKRFFNRYFSVIGAVFFSLIFVVFMIRFFYSRPRIVASIIEDDLKLIVLALDKIDARCSILGFEDDYNEVDFLNIGSFVGSQVGPMSLAYPRKWEGPYLRVNPSLQGIFYEVVRAKDGFFVVPGRGTKLPSGLVVGKDFKITPETSVSNLIEEGGPLKYGNSFLVEKLIFEIGDWGH